MARTGNNKDKNIFTTTLVNRIGVGCKITVDIDQRLAQKPNELVSSERISIPRWLGARDLHLHLRRISTSVRCRRVFAAG